MIVTVTLNPSLDLTYGLRESALGEVDVHRARTATIEASGKGVNVSLTLQRVGTPTVAVVLLGGGTGQHVSELLEQEGVEHAAVPVDGQTRINTSLLLPTGETTKVNGPGPTVSPHDLEVFSRELRHTLDAVRGEDERWLALCGSFPPGAGEELVTEVIEVGHRRGFRCVVDVSGAPLRRALLDGADLLAPNAAELASLVPGEVDLREPGALAQAAHELARSHHTTLLVSLGSGGALHTDGTLMVHGNGPVLTPVNTAGAGDAFLSGWLAHPGEPISRMSRAMAFGRSACLSPLTVDRTPGRHATDGITVSAVSPSSLERTTP
ncbi:MAG: 1-phosphofructokinase family hexose kinase [Ornithinimicrobium sp.]